MVIPWFQFYIHNLLQSSHIPIVVTILHKAISNHYRAIRAVENWAVRPQWPHGTMEPCWLVSLEKVISFEREETLEARAILHSWN